MTKKGDKDKQGNGDNHEGMERLLKAIGHIPPDLHETRKKKILTALSAAMIAEKIRDSFPDMSPEDALKAIANALIGLPDWGKEAGGFQIGVGTVFNSGAFCVYWGEDPNTGKIVTLLHTRKETKEDGEHKLGAVGGYTTRPEQAVAGLKRETGQEVCDDKGKPVFIPDERKYVLVLEGKDFRDGSGKIPVQYTGYAYELAPDEIKALKAYNKQMEQQNYSKAVLEASEGETHGAGLIPLEDVVKMSPADFTYHRHYDLYREVASRLGLEVEGLAHSKPPCAIGFRVGDSLELNMSRRVYRDGVMTRFTPERLVQSKGNGPGPQR